MLAMNSSVRLAWSSMRSLFSAFEVLEPALLGFRHSSQRANMFGILFELLAVFDSAGKRFVRAGVEGFDVDA